MTAQEQCAMICQLCVVDPKVKWKCLKCELLMCMKCKDKVHAKFKTDKEHRVIDIKELQLDGIEEYDAFNLEEDEEMMTPRLEVKITNIKKFPTTLENITILAISLDDSLWIGDGEEQEGFHPFSKPTALQKVKVETQKLKVISTFNIGVWDIAITNTNDLLMATRESKLKQIINSCNRVSESTYEVHADSFIISCVHVTKNGKVIIGANKKDPEHREIIGVMDTDGSRLTWHENDKNQKPLFEYPMSITSTTNENIFVADLRRVVVLGKVDVIRVYHPIIKLCPFRPKSVVTTPLDNVIVADCHNHSLHILNNTGHSLTTYTTSCHWSCISLLTRHRFGRTIHGSIHWMQHTRR
ncbi:uncharacterized protein LOC134708647 [Mytilus trossulus]|uniref:uncharacterized protein LOC134708647 n=1 Tax=Mytilus trossulus TaxID=6551 RepID=UPI003003EE7B